MKARSEDLDGLLSLQQIDRDVAKQKKKLDNLPERELIAEARSKLDSMASRRDQVLKLKAEALDKRQSISVEDEALAEKEASVDAELKETRGDFRGAEARSKELAGISKRREDLACDMSRVDEELEKIEGVEAQIDRVVDEAEKKESDASAALEREEEDLNDSIEQLERKRADVVSTMADDIVALYEKTAANTGGVAVGYLAGDSCGICRTPIEGGRLIDLRAQAPLGVCPACKRLLIIEAAS